MDTPAAALPARPHPAPGDLRQVFTVWWPLAASWVLMSLELPAVSAAMARLPDPRIHLAAYGGIVFPLSMMVEAPIIMLLAASTALVRDLDSYRKLRRVTLWAAGGLTLVHLAIALTPLFDLVVGGIMGAPEEIRGPSRVGLIIMTPWTASIAYRRFQQGVLIRFGHSRAVGIGTVIRLAAILLVIALGFLIGNLRGVSLPGVWVGASAVAAGVIAEAVYAGLRVRPVIRNQVAAAPAAHPALTLNAFLHFYVPLALTSVIVLATMPITSAGLSRLADPLASLATWPVVGGLLFLLRSLGIAYNEVVVALLDEPAMRAALRRFALVLGTVLTVLLFAVVATPLGIVWFRDISGLPEELTRLGRIAAWFGLVAPALGVAQSWYQGTLVHARRTRGITESVALNLIVMSLALAAAVRWYPGPGLHAGIAAASLGGVVQILWLRFRARQSEFRTRQSERASA